MAWLDDRIWCHPKLSDLDDRSFRVFINGVAYSSGFARAGVLTPGQQATIGSDDVTRDRLVTAGLWHLVGEDVAIHDWDEHNAQRDAKRAADRVRKRKQRERERESRVTPSVTPPVTGRGQAAGPARVDGVKSEEKEQSQNHVADVTRDIHEHWRLTFGKTRANYDTISPERRRKIEARLRDGYTPGDLKAAITNAANDDWEGRAKHNDLTLILRSREKIDYFIDLGQPTNGHARETPDQFRARIAAIDARWADTVKGI